MRLNLGRLTTLLAGLLVAGGISLYAQPAEANGVTREIFRLYNPNNGDHMSSSDRYEASWQGYYAESSLYYYTNPYGAGTGTPVPAHPVYRCRVNYDHMESRDPGCEGWPNEGALGYLLDWQASGTIAYYRCRQWGNGEHFNSTDPGCEGHINEGNLGYGMPGNAYPRATLAGSSGSGECVGRCGLGCSWMPWEAYTDACYEHDMCVAQRGHLSCLPGLFNAAVSYVWAGAKSLVKSVVSFVSSLFDWW